MPATKPIKKQIKKAPLQNKKQDLEPMGGFTQVIEKENNCGKFKVALLVVILAGIILIVGALWYGFKLCDYTHETQGQNLIQPTSNVTEKLKELVEEKIVEPDVLEQEIGIIKDTPTGYLNVRKGPGVDYGVLIQVNPGEEYNILNEKDNWYQIEAEAGLFGWVFNEYVEKI